MAPSECSPEEALASMAALLRSTDFERAECTRLFERAIQGNRSLACKRFIDGIEVLIRRKMCPADEIRRAYEALTESAAPVTMIDVLSDTSNAARLARVLRRQACRLLVNDGNAEVPLAALQDVALCGDSGRLTVIDFLVTRRRPSTEHADLLIRLMKEMSNQKVIIENQRRCEYILRTLKLTNALDALDPELVAAIRLHDVSAAPEEHTPVELTPIELIVSATEIKRNVKRLQALTTPEMAHWLAILRRASTDQNRTHTDKSRYAISNVLGNLARTFQGNPIVVDILAVAIELEAAAQEPSPYVFDKLQRVCVAALRHGGAAFAVMAHTLTLCTKRISLHPGDRTTDGYDARLGEAACLLIKLADWKPLVDAIANLHDRQARTVVAQNVVMFMKQAGSMTLVDHGAGRRKEADRLMRLALASSLRNKKERIRLHEAYMLNFSTCFDEHELGAYATDETLDIYSRMTAAALWSQTAPHADEAYKRCASMFTLLPGMNNADLKRITALQRLLQVHAFVDISERLNAPVTLHDDAKPITGSEMTKALSDARYHTPPLEGINIAYQAFRTLRNAGDHFDAYCALQTMILRARELTGDSGVRFRAYRRALTKYMLEELQLPDGMVQNAVFEKYGRDERLEDGLQENVESVCRSVLSRPRAEVLRTFHEEYDKLEATIDSDPVLGIAAGSAMALPLLAVYMGRVANVGIRKLVQARISNLVQEARDIDSADWIDRLRVSEKMMLLNGIATSLRAPPSMLQKIDPHSTEKVQGMSILAMRAYLSQRQQVLSASDAEFTEVPDDMICLSLNFDSTDTLLLTRREQGSTAVTVRLPEGRTALLNPHKQAVAYNQALTEIKNIVHRAASIEVTEDSSSERERFWRLQYALDDAMQKTLVSVQRSWIGGFTALFSPRPGALNVSREMLDALSMTIRAHVPLLPANSLALSMALGACMREAALSKSLDQLQDLLSSLFDSLILQGASVSVDEIDLSKLAEDLQTQVRRFAQPQSECKGEPKHIVLVCDRKASAIPWEMLPVLQKCSVTRAMSLNQVAEWAKQRQERQAQTQHDEKVTVILNPQGNLPRTQEKFDTEFRLRGWQGFIGTTPTREQFVEAFVGSSNLVYVGHGSGSMLAEPVAIRRLFLTQTGVYLFGCSSVAIQHPLFNKDIMTSYAVAGCRVIMGTLWNVKDKDCNRFTSEFLSRVFDDKEHAGKALWEARKACMLPYLTSAAWVMYGLP